MDAQFTIIVRHLGEDQEWATVDNLDDALFQYRVAGLAYGEENVRMGGSL